MRLAIAGGTALLILWQSGCLTIEDGAIVNRCGAWQWVTRQPMRISLGQVQERVRVERIEVPGPVRIERVEIPQAAPAAPADQCPVGMNCTVVVARPSRSYPHASFSSSVDYDPRGYR